MVRWNQVRALLLAILLLPSSVHAAWPKPAAGVPEDDHPEILFTFDDGPHHVYTARLLDVLKKRGVQGLFFWVGHRISRRSSTLPKRLEIVKRAVREGHLIGTHTVNHVHLCAIPEEVGAQEIDTAIAMYEELTGLPMTFFRAPYGDHCPRAIKLLTDRGIRNFHWDIDPREWRHLDADRTADDIIDVLRHLDGRAVVLIHDTKAAAAKSVPRVLDWIEKENIRREKRGYRKTIRVLSPSDLVLERIPPSLVSWIRGTATDGRVALSRHLATLLPGYQRTILSAR